jgi:hypothetical protein
MSALGRLVPRPPLMREDSPRSLVMKMSTLPQPENERRLLSSGQSSPHRNAQALRHLRVDR